MKVFDVLRKLLNIEESETISNEEVFKGLNCSELSFFSYNNDTLNFEDSFIDMHFQKGSELIKLRFFMPVELEIEKGFSGNLSGFSIIDIRKRQMEDIGYEIINFEQDPGITFKASHFEVLN